MSERKETVARRTLLGGALTAGAALGAASLVRGPAPPAPEAPKTTADTATGAQGYRVTDHIRRYYATARV